MNTRDAWILFVAGAIASGKSVASAAKMADEARQGMKKRFVEYDDGWREARPLVAPKSSVKT